MIQPIIFGAMAQKTLDTPIEYLKGIGPQRADLLKKELGIYVFGDLLQFFPFRYEDRTKVHQVQDISGTSAAIQLIGRISGFKESGVGRKKRLNATFSDETGDLDLVWFKGVNWVKKSLKSGGKYIIYGKPSMFNNQYNMAHPEIEGYSVDRQKKGLQAIYPGTEKLNNAGLTSKFFRNVMPQLLREVYAELIDPLPTPLVEQYKLCSSQEAYLWAHQPKDVSQIERARFRLKLEELFFIQLRLLRSKISHQRKFKGHVFDKVGDLFNQFYTEHLPFELTGAQKRVIKEIRKDLASGVQMNRLLQGDVGSGKTMVALMIILIALDSGFQGAIMAPTEILATQHFQSITQMVGGLGLEVALLTGSTKAAERKVMLEKLSQGEIHIMIGTHALLEDRVKFDALGVVVIDEQHRFGVAQRARLWTKASVPPHVLVMTATPIPRTLAMTLYGDLDVSVIDELPPGRKPVKTVHRRDSARLKVFGFIAEEIAKGRQVYIVYPLIAESEKLDYKDLTDGYDSICRAFPSPQYQVGILHGQMKPADKDWEMDRFVKGETQILVATTVIEVGVNVPNASVMIIESAERFGLSQLHQLRGRVGRGAEQSFCILMTGNKLSSEAKERIQTMCQSSDGFEIAEVDLKLRGPGDLAGTQQSGMLNLRMADLTKDQQILQLARTEAIALLKADPDLSDPAHNATRTHLIRLQQAQPNWGRIS